MADLAALARSVFAVGFSGRSVAEAPWDELRAFGPGAIVVFGRNVAGPDELRDLIAALRALSDPPPLIAVDQEGGRVARIGPPAVAALPSAMALGATGDAALCERLGTRLGRDLAALGISVDLAPVADLALEPANTVIGTRAFGSDPARVGELATAFARGLGRGGVAATLKHFPGHGGTIVDSHLALPRIAAPAHTLRSRDLVPFARALAADAAPLVMAGHVVVEAFDDRRPATLSPAVLSSLLRGELGFRGVVCTDCLEMDAIARGIGSAPGALAALEAGADLLLMSHTLALAREAAEAVTAAAAQPRVASRLAEAAARVGALRARYRALRPFGDALDAGEPRIAVRRAITVVRGRPRLRAGLPVSVVSFEGTSFDGAAGSVTRASLSTALRQRRWQSEVMRVPLEPSPDDIALLLDELGALGDRNVVLVVRRAHLYPLQYGAVGRLVERFPGAIVVSAAEPYDALMWPRAAAVACTYGDDEATFDACAEMLAGNIDAGGTLPVPVDRAA